MPTPETVAELTLFWVNKTDKLEEIIKELRAAITRDVGTYNSVIEALRTGELPWERVQIMESGQLRVTEPPQPVPVPEPVPVPDTCVKEISEGFGKRNGKKDGIAEVASAT